MKQGTVPLTRTQLALSRILTAFFGALLLLLGIEMGARAFFHAQLLPRWAEDTVYAVTLLALVANALLLRRIRSHAEDARK